MSSRDRARAFARVASAAVSRGLPAPRQVALHDDASTVHLTMDDPIEVDAWADHLGATPISREIGLPGAAHQVREAVAVDSDNGIWAGWTTVRISAVALREQRVVRP